MSETTYRCEICQSEATVHIDVTGLHFCQSCLEKIDARIQQMLLKAGYTAKKCPACGGQCFLQENRKYPVLCETCQGKRLVWYGPKE